jgi:hypothetical protein
MSAGIKNQFSKLIKKLSGSDLGLSGSDLSPPLSGRTTATLEEPVPMPPWRSPRHHCLGGAYTSAALEEPTLPWWSPRPRQRCLGGARAHVSAALEEPAPMLPWRSPCRHYLQEPTTIEESCRFEKPAPVPSWCCLAVAWR